MHKAWANCLDAINAMVYILQYNSTSNFTQWRQNTKSFFVSYTIMSGWKD